MSKHTSGPWVYQDGTRHVFEDDTGYLIAEVSDNSGHVDPEYQEPMPTESNAHLIAAAPELLHLANDFLRLIDAGEFNQEAKLRDRVRAVIDKANGGK